MGIVVTGIGPRSGTSAMMRTLISWGWEPHESVEPFPTYVAHECNPKGYWDMTVEWLQRDDLIVSLGEKEVSKVWSPIFPRVDWSTVDLIVVMHREDQEAQLRSIRKTAEAEGIKAREADIDRMMWEPRILLQDLDVPKLYIETEHLRRNSRKVLRTIKENL